MRKTATAASGLALVLALTACGSEDNAGSDGSFSGMFSDPQALFQAASEGTSKSKSSKFQMDMNMAGMQLSASGEALYDGADTAMSMTMDVAGQSMEIRMVDQTMYMKLPDAMSSQMGGKAWVKISADGSDPLSQQMGSSFDQMAEQSDPAKTLEYIQKAGKIVNSEQTNLDGQDVTHYTIELDFAKIADDMGASSGLTAEQAQQLASEVGTVPMELWLTSDNLPVQIKLEMSKVMEAAGAPGQSGEMVMKYTDWGAPVNVEAPPADQVGELPSN
ncbi:hypothetical protein ABZ863_06535 [Saccharomonospora sp. NPDC046836]|uniref:hypothetical protein n=1 Tax=Saccharomonospora sp. NPDC046836 TaxID=3156921 RepID=UPI0033E41FDC